MKRARCTGQHMLYDSTDPRDHRKARRLCEACPVQAACMSVALRTAKKPGRSPDGTWAGVLWRDGRVVPA